jgi:hypothetical protein
MSAVCASLSFAALLVKHNYCQLGYMKQDSFQESEINAIPEDERLPSKATFLRLAIQ